MVNAGRLEAKGGSQGAGIGGGTSNTDGAGDCGDVIVNGGKVIATTTSWGAGIGGAVPWIKSGGNLKADVFQQTVWYTCKAVNALLS